ncbi:MAG: enoyl-CoA hydratase/isomerase family protein [Lacibacter sp.]|nr:enoyl-CoA hydratase/isomerase family protein [Lacibacter sp.]
MLTQINEAYVKKELHKGIATVEFYHPQSNSLPGSLLSELAQYISQLAHDPNVLVIVLKSSGEKAFCAGASFDELVSIKNEAEGLKFFSGFAQVINAMRKCPKFIVARIHGKCVGGGVGIAAAADYAIAVEGADVKLSELAVGIGPFVVGPAVERKIGVSAFSQLSIDAASWRNADWAKRKGLFSELHPTIEEMDESISKLANTLSHFSPEAMHEMKKIFWKGAEHWDELLIDRAKISGRLALSEFTKNSIAKFKAKS